jgi:protein O-mannosyl-transferase
MTNTSVRGTEGSEAPVYTSSNGTGTGISSRLIRSLRKFLLRPSLWVGIITCIAYWDNTALHGSFVYDDAGSIKMNAVVTGKVPWTEAFYRDFWGTKMNEIQSHKSFRPITTLSFKLNWMYALYEIHRKKQKTNDRNVNDNTTIHDIPITVETINEMNMFGFHLVNLLLHCLVTILVTEVSYYVFTSPIVTTGRSITGGTTCTTGTITIGQLITGCIFGLHPVHVEAVTNITSRGELFMSFFYLLSFFICIQHIHIQQPPSSIQSEQERKQRTNRFLWQQTLGIYLYPWICMTCSVFSKEQGATALLTIILYDFIQNHYSIYTYLQSLVHRLYTTTKNNNDNDTDDDQNNGTTISDTNNSHIAKDDLFDTSTPSTEQYQHQLILLSKQNMISFLRRAIILTIQTIIVALYRYWLNGITKPDFIYDQNPAGFASDRFTRICSICYVYCLYIYDSIYPMYLGPDWSGVSIDLITQWHDVRLIGVIMLWIFTAICVWTLIFGMQPSTSSFISIQMFETRRMVLLAFFAFLFCPFLLSSNLLVVVGLMKADRVIYLPLMGFALIEAILVMNVFYRPAHTTRSIREKSRLRWRYVGNLIVLLQLTFFAAKLHERNVAWSHSLNLWTAAYNLNSRSKHTMYNCGYELSLKQRYIEAEYVLRPIGDPHVDGPSNTFIYAMVLFNLNRCTEALYLIEEALKVVEEKRRIGGPRNSESSLIRTKSNLLVAQGFCTLDDIQLSGQRFYQAVQADPTNEYAIEQANKMVQRIENLKQLEQQRARLGLI